MCMPVKEKIKGECSGNVQRPWKCEMSPRVVRGAEPASSVV